MASPLTGLGGETGGPIAISDVTNLQATLDSLAGGGGGVVVQSGSGLSPMVDATTLRRILGTASEVSLNLDAQGQLVIGLPNSVSLNSLAVTGSLTSPSLDAKQDAIGAGDLAIADTAGLQAALGGGDPSCPGPVRTTSCSGNFVYLLPFFSCLFCWISHPQPPS